MEEWLQVGGLRLQNNNRVDTGTQNRQWETCNLINHEPIIT